ncbi:hypothetical protein AAZX31_13G249600 [Glycine max]|nr:hypothetical protein JHK85_038139 [Glycine max]KAG4978106.1 hypothetical protein JHK86_037580 [Glycine max]KAG5114116.1 hypothetical protein JHK82_037385 [Glycine max]KAG5131393.1 hypothetical protein JHK84_037790 [Glycine max]
MPRLLGNLTPQILVQALRSMPRQATSSLKVRTHGGTRGSGPSHGSVGGKRRSPISQGKGGQHNEVVQKMPNGNNGSKRNDEARVEANAAKKLGN